jgi:hypothetical protein
MVRSWRAAVITAALLFGVLFPPRARAQLRPLEQADWRLIGGQGRIAGSFGAAKLFDQRASLAGATGDLWEAGNFSLAWRSGRVVLEVGGTSQRFFSETGRFAEPHPEVDADADGDRHDSGDYRISTSVRLTPESWPFVGAVRFGTRLPTTDNETGLDRDAVDFFATLGGAGSLSSLFLAAEAGLGIHSTREVRFEQEDVLVYSARAELRGFAVVPSIAVLGQMHGPSHAAIRGVEDLGELRAGLQAGSRYWLRIEGVKGYETFSPETGVIVSIGSRF